MNDKLADYELPAGYQLVFSGENEMIVDAMEQVMLMLAHNIYIVILVCRHQSGRAAGISQSGSNLGKYLRNCQTVLYGFHLQQTAQVTDQVVEAILSIDDVQNVGAILAIRE